MAKKRPQARKALLAAAAGAATLNLAGCLITSGNLVVLTCEEEGVTGEECCALEGLSDEECCETYSDLEICFPGDAGQPQPDDGGTSGDDAGMSNADGGTADGGS